MNASSEILSLVVTRCSYKTFLESVIHLSEQRRSSYVCFANVHMLVECHSDARFREMVNSADLVAADGKPIAVLAQLLSKKKQEKISGPDLFVSLLRECEQLNKTVFFFGSTSAVLKKLIEKTHRTFPLLRIAGSYAPPFRELTTDEEENITTRINSQSPDFVFVALGCPKQEKWMAEHKGIIRACMLGVGQAFQVFSGEVKRAPAWMQQAGLEWIFRLLEEPGRLWKRYLSTNLIFLYLLLKKGIQSLTAK